MQRMQWLFIVGAAALLSLGLLILAGCGGGGGPLTQVITTGGPSPSAQFLALLPAVQRSATPVGTAKCVECHKDPHKDPDPAKLALTVHAKNNVGCESCHGAGSAHVASPAKTNILTGTDSTRPQVCGQCHGPIQDDFLRSRHASAIEEVLTSAETSPATGKTCLRCHSAAFRAVTIDEPLSRTGTTVAAVDQATRDQIDANITALPNDQVSTIVAGTKESASCTTCHDPHRNTGNLNSEGSEQYLRRATFSTDTTFLQPGTPVKNYTTIDHMCGTCHNGRGVDASDAALAKAVRPGMHNGPQFNMLLGVGGSEKLDTGTVTPTARTSSHSIVPNQCVHCHLPNQRHTFTVSLDTSCSPCHTAADAASREDALKSEILNALTGLKTRMEQWAKTTYNDTDLWDYSENIKLILDANGNPKAAPDQTKVPVQIKRARHNYYFVARDRSFGVHNSVYTRYMLDIANRNLDALNVPRSVAQPGRSVAQLFEVINQDLRRGARSSMSELR